MLISQRVDLFKAHFALLARHNALTLTFTSSNRQTIRSKVHADAHITYFSLRVQSDAHILAICSFTTPSLFFSIWSVVIYRLYFPSEQPLLDLGHCIPKPNGSGLETSPIMVLSAWPAEGVLGLETEGVFDRNKAGHREMVSCYAP